MKVLRILEKSKEFWLLIFTSFLFFVLRLPSLFEPIWYGDEGIYQVIGDSLNNGKLLYTEIFDNKPPLLYWLYAILNSDQFTVRLASLLFGLFSVIIFFFLSKKLFKESRIHILTTFIFAVLFGLPMYEGNIANAENFMLFPILASAFFIINQKRFLVAGLLLGLAFLFKIVAIFDFAAFLIFCFIVNFDSLKKEVKIFPFVFGFSLPIIAVTIFFISNGTFTDFLKAALFTNISYVSWGNNIGNLPFLLILKLIVLGIFTLYIFTKRKIFGKSALFILLWLAFSLFNALFSQRPYTHYVLVLISSLSLMIGLVLSDKKHQKIFFIFLLISLVVLIKVFGTPKPQKNIYYYQNFISYVYGAKTMMQYQAFFDRNTPVDYEIARFIRPKLRENDTIFVWGNNAQLYKMVGVVAPTKYVVAYHMINYKDGIENTKKQIEKTKPKFIVVMTNNSPLPFPLMSYSKKINIEKAIIYERTF